LQSHIGVHLPSPRQYVSQRLSTVFHTALILTQKLVFVCTLQYLYYWSPFVGTENSKLESLEHLPALENSRLILLKMGHIYKSRSVDKGPTDGQKQTLSAWLKQLLVWFHSPQEISALSLPVFALSDALLH